MPIRTTSAAIALTTTLAFASLGGCIYGASATKESGTRVGPSTFERIVAGETTDRWVKATLGEPSRQSTYDDGRELWVYSYSKEERSGGTFLFIIGGKDQTSTRETTYVEFDAEGVVIEAWKE